jgi:hypothetical protein
MEKLEMFVTFAFLVVAVIAVLFVFPAAFGYWAAGWPGAVMGPPAMYGIITAMVQICDLGDRNE